MTHLLLLLPLLVGQAESPPPVLKMEGSTTGTVAPPPAPAPTPAPATPPADAPAARGAPVFLTINSNRPDLLLVRDDNSETQCTVPCNKLVPAGPKDRYHLGGPGLTNSNDFDLADGIKAARIDVRAGTKLGKIAGIALTAFGLPLLLSGGLGMVSYGILQDPAIQAQMAANGTQSFISPTVSLILALVELGVGAITGTLGLILWPMNATTMTVKPTEPPANVEPAPVEPPPAEPAPAQPATAP